MPKPLPVTPVRQDLTVTAVFEEDAEALIAEQKPALAGYLKARGFKGKPGAPVIAPGGTTAKESANLVAFFGLGPRRHYDPMSFRSLAAGLPKGVWTLKVDPALDRHSVHVAWALGAYRFTRYRKESEGVAVLDDAGLSEAERKAVAAEVRAHTLVRDLVNTPAEDMGPSALEAEASRLCDAHGATLTVTTGDALLSANYPAIHAVGRAAAADRAPRLLEIAWRPKDREGPLPVIALVGKGVTFDTGGLNLKTGSGMGLMKKDMGGAAHALALSGWIMEAGLPLELKTFLPVVENAVSGPSLRPGDVIGSRAGLTIEVGNTDAEGRLILADALTRAAEFDPALCIDFATLTGAARVALGPEVIPFYCDNEETSRRLEVAALAKADPVWRMPLWAGYRSSLESDIADLRNDPQGWAQAGSVTAALFLQRFAPTTGPWVHFDIYAWNPKGRSGWPTGAEAQTLRAVFALLKDF